MTIENGTYFVRFATPLGSGGGVFTLRDGRLRGGDGAMVYVGSYAEPQPDHIAADVRASTHTAWPGQTSVFGLNELDLRLAGPIVGGSGTVTGTSPQAPGVPFNAYVERYCD